ncbi:hypothetical protein BB8028_0004g00280 [Beauveria bassiana]|uniref:Uncharacterized protein n=1 Tax=Beauveria bassiana TaxID=176275 RepID=A0A2S7YAB8_BEABA|nr:hypothetical protein BB8028_0004g00280 [Beauveria bassiana]
MSTVQRQVFSNLERSKSILDDDKLLPTSDSFLVNLQQALDLPHTPASPDSATGDFAGSLKEFSATSWPIPPSSTPNKQLVVSSDREMERSPANDAQSQCLSFCGSVIASYDSIAEKMSGYAGLVSHLPHSFVVLAKEVLGACDELSSIYGGLSNAVPGQTLPADLITVMKKNLRGAQDQALVLDQVVTKLLDHERKGAMSRLRRGFGKMFSDNHIERVTSGVTKTHENLKVGSLLLQWKVGSPRTESELGIGCISLAAAIETATGQPLKRYGYAKSMHTDDAASYHAPAMSSAASQHRSIDDQRALSRQQTNHVASPPLNSPPLNIIHNDKASSVNHGSLHGMSSVFSSNEDSSATRYTMSSTESSNDGRARQAKRLPIHNEWDKPDENTESALDSLVEDIKALDLDSSEVVRKKSLPLDMPHREPRTMVARDKPNSAEALVSAVRAGDHRAVQELLDCGAPPDTGAESHGLNDAISGHDNESVRLLLLYGASPNALDREGQSPLAVAADKSSLEAVIALLKYGANPNSAARGTHSALSIAISAGNAQIAHVLLIYGATPNQMTSSGNTLLIESIGKKSPKSLTAMLLKYGAAPNEKSREGKTALFEAITNGRDDIVGELIKHGADPNLPGPKHMLWPAQSYPECLRILLANAADYKKTPGIMELATSINSIDSIRLLLKAGVDPNAKKDGVYTPLCTAIRDNRADIFELLLRNGADPNVPASEYPAFKCITHHREHFLPPLLAAGAKLDTPKGIAETAVAYKNLKVLKWLLEKGIDVDDKCPKGYTPLTTAIRENNIEAVETLLAYGANPNVRGQDWPVCMAVRYPSILKRILSVLQEPRAFKGVMEMAVVAGQLQSVKLLRAAGVSVEDRNGGVFSPLTSAIREYRTEIVAFLIGEGGADVNAPGEHLPIVKALRRRQTDSTEIIDMLLEKGADPNKMYRGWNGIMQALENGDLDMLKKLAGKSGVDLDVRDELGRTVTEIAISRRWEDAVNVLLSNKAKSS